MPLICHHVSRIFQIVLQSKGVRLILRMVATKNYCNSGLGGYLAGCFIRKHSHRVVQLAWDCTSYKIIQGSPMGQKEEMITLLENGHDLNSKDSNDRTPLSWAVEKGHEAVVKLLLEKGAKKLQ